MNSNCAINKVLWIITALLSIAAAVAGIAIKGLYTDLFPREFLPGALPQDILTFVMCCGMLVLVATVRQNSIKQKIVILGIMGSLFYLYGIFTIERVYNWCYLIYAAIFACAFWSMIYGLSGFKNEAFAGMRYSMAIVRTTAIASLVIAAVFVALWTVQLVPLMRDRNRIEYLYSIYILDLCFVMPAFVITAVMSLRRVPMGILMAPAIMILGFFVIFPLGLNELAKFFSGQALLVGPMVVSFAFAFFMLALCIAQLGSIRFHENRDGGS